MDRNCYYRDDVPNQRVALRKESVDRNFRLFFIIFDLFRSLSARRAWIEMRTIQICRAMPQVALRKESVDRNALSLLTYRQKFGRSPQGERG